MTVNKPVITHATSSQPGEPTCRDISLETIKMPEPIIEPATIIVESSSPSPRTKPACLSSTPTATSDICSSGNVRAKTAKLIAHKTPKPLKLRRCAAHVMLRDRHQIHERQHSHNDSDYQC